MGSAASGFRGERLNILPVEQRRVGRSQIAGNHNPLTGQMIQQLPFLPVEILQNPVGDVGHIGRPLLQILIVHRRNRGDVAADDLAEHHVRGLKTLPDLGNHLLSQHLVIDDQQMGVENACLACLKGGLHRF